MVYYKYIEPKLTPDMLCPQKLPYHAYRTRKIVSAERYNDVSHTEQGIHLQMKISSFCGK